MQTLSPSADRIGGALKALRRLQSQNGNSEDKRSRGAQCLRVLVDQFTEEGVPQEDLQPLVELEALLQTLREQPQGTSVAKRRRDVRRARRCSPARAP